MICNAEFTKRFRLLTSCKKHRNRTKSTKLFCQQSYRLWGKSFTGETFYDIFIEKWRVDVDK